jgi:hypothetical protein
MSKVALMARWSFWMRLGVEKAVPSNCRITTSSTSWFRLRRRAVHAHGRHTILGANVIGDLFENLLGVADALPLDAALAFDGVVPHLVLAVPGEALVLQQVRDLLGRPGFKRDLKALGVGGVGALEVDLRAILLVGQVDGVLAARLDGVAAGFLAVGLGVGLLLRVLNRLLGDLPSAACC